MYGVKLESMRWLPKWCKKISAHCFCLCDILCYRKHHICWKRRAGITFSTVHFGAQALFMKSASALSTLQRTKLPPEIPRLPLKAYMLFQTEFRLPALWLIVWSWMRPSGPSLDESASSWGVYAVSARIRAAIAARDVCWWLQSRCGILKHMFPRVFAIDVSFLYIFRSCKRVTILLWFMVRSAAEFMTVVLRIYAAPFVFPICSTIRFFNLCTDAIGCLSLKAESCKKLITISVFRSAAGSAFMGISHAPARISQKVCGWNYRTNENDGRLSDEYVCTMVENASKNGFTANTLPPTKCIETALCNKIRCPSQKRKIRELFSRTDLVYSSKSHCRRQPH